MAKLKAVVIRWRDSFVSSRWQDYDGGLHIHEITSIGWLLEDTKDKLVIALSHDEHPHANEWADILVVPREAIVSKKVVKYE